jgi:hypothetical protein
MLEIINGQEIYFYEAANSPGKVGEISGNIHKP